MRVCPFGSYDWVCTDESPCFECEEAEHADRHPDFDDPDCPTCRMRSIQLNPRTVRPTSFNNVAPEGNRNSWESGVAHDHRGIPYRDNSGNTIPVKRFAEKRAEYEESIRRNHAGL
jgi:hypothetical protein